MTVAFWFNHPDVGSKSGNTPFSYAESRKSNNRFLVYDVDRPTAYVGSFQARSRTGYADGRWHHVCMTWKAEGDDGKGEMYVDGELVSLPGKGSHFSKIMRADGAAVLGQEQDKVGGGFSNAQAYEGRLNRLNVFDRYMTAEDCAEVQRDVCAFADRTKCGGNVLSWDDVVSGVEDALDVPEADRASCGSYVQVGAGICTADEDDNLELDADGVCWQCDGKKHAGNLVAMLDAGSGARLKLEETTAFDARETRGFENMLLGEHGEKGAGDVKSAHITVQAAHEPGKTLFQITNYAITNGPEVCRGVKLQRLNAAGNFEDVEGGAIAGAAMGKSGVTTMVGGKYGITAAPATAWRLVPTGGAAHVKDEAFCSLARATLYGSYGFETSTPMWPRQLRLRRRLYGG